MMGGRFPGMAGPPQKSKHFKRSARRLLARLARDRSVLVLVIALAVTGSSLTVSGPIILGHATNVIFAGVIGPQLPAGHTKAEGLEILRANGQGKLADLASGMDVVPQQGIDFAELVRTLSIVLMLLAGSSLFLWLQGYVLNRVVQRTARELRAEVQDKMSRLPLAYFDRTPHGELLSRVTNDIDNVATTLQQSLSQMMNSLLLVIGVLVMLRGDLAAARDRRTRHDPGLDHVDRGDREAFAGAVRDAVEARRCAQRADRGGVHRALAGQGARPPPRRRGAVRGQERRSCSRPDFARS